jgi:hypothetical protein
VTAFARFNRNRAAAVLTFLGVGFRRLFFLLFRYFVDAFNQQEHSECHNDEANGRI